MKEELCFDDILLLPRYSELGSRTTPDISTMIGGIVKLKLPLMSAAMDSITGERMLIAMDKAGGVGILSRYINMEHDTEVHKQVLKIKGARSAGASNVGCAIGIKDNPTETAARLLAAGCNIICIDVAHADHSKVYEATRQIARLRDKHEFVLMVGNVCTGIAATRLVEAGANCIKVGIGPGAACTTRIVTGFGRPQLFAIQECVDTVKHLESACTTSIRMISYLNGHRNISIIADGGLKTSGDIIKSLWGGASACMMGYMLAGTNCTPDIEGQRVYRGMSSRSASGRSDIAPEGVEFPVAYKGTTEEKLREYQQGIKSGLAMAGAMNIEELRECECVKVSPLCILENHPRLK
ncbi:hypothetical protein LCGC14_2200810 [marine sediment metagenome]|uniref:IMP dehydrogenase/GMP reductase domain-containing protein n=1 Tax=marine sediment metagenome TaxID=412755 RepID=A0A0F9E408_9ZZZZ